MTNPLVSIIVPVYNAQKGLSRCLESICGQTYQELQIILLNDGSTDDSLAICEQFRAKDARIMVVDKENEGVSRTRNAGLALAQGDYIQFADSDDLLDPDYTQNLVQAALQHSADLVIAPYWMVIPSNSSKTGHALETLQESLGIEPEAPKTEVHKYGFLLDDLQRKEYFKSRNTGASADAPVFHFHGRSRLKKHLLCLLPGLFTAGVLFGLAAGFFAGGFGLDRGIVQAGHCIQQSALQAV